MNTNTSNGVSKLASMQAEFQRRQLQEKEQKLFKLNNPENHSSVTMNKGLSNLTPKVSDHQQGKSKLQKAGQIIPETQATNNNSSGYYRSGGMAGQSSSKQRTQYQTPSSQPADPDPVSSSYRLRPPQVQVFNTGTKSKIRAESKPIATTHQRSGYEQAIAQDRGNGFSAVRYGNGNTVPAIYTTNEYGKNTPAAIVQAQRPKSRAPASKMPTYSTAVAPVQNGSSYKAPSAQSAGPSSSGSHHKIKPSQVLGKFSTASNSSGAAPAAATRKKPTDKPSGKFQRTEPPPEGTVPCSQCGRCFNKDRIAKHETICKKTSNKKRKIFDPTKMRVAGTEAEAFLNVKRLPIKGNKKATAAAASSSTNKPKVDWRKTHEEFIQAIRAAKVYQQHVAAGGNPKDIPPPPPSDNSHYVQCPHCKRKFNPGAAERHIPKCTSMKSKKR